MSQRKAPSSPGKAAAAAITTEVRPDDSDLEDLLGHSNGTPPVSKSGAHKVVATQAEKDDEERVPLVGPASIASTSKSKGPNNDDDSKGHASSEKSALDRKRFLQQQRASATGFSYHPEQGSCLQYCTAYASLICYYHPWVCSSLAIGVGLALMLALVNAVFNPVGTYGVMPHDHSNIRSKYDLSMSKIDHWCLGGGNENCLCEDPLTPSSQMHRKAWVKAFWENKERVVKYQDRLRGSELDVAFVGESLVEEMSGRWLGRSIPPLMPIRQAFESRFSRDRGGRLEGVALGIAGDTAPNVLYRLMHGEMPDYLQPKVWWLVLGMNDLSRMQCSEEVTVLGILRVVEEILERRPNSRVVINSLLPMAYSRGGQYALLHDYQDSLGEMGNKKRDRIKNDPASDSTSANDEKDGWRRRLRSNRTRTDAAPDDDTAEETRLETKQRQKEGKRKRGKENVVLDAEAHKAHKYNFLTGLLSHRAKSPPLWTSVYAINKELQAFAKNNDNVDFFDATHVFADQREKGKFELRSAMISARGHPTPAGFRDWEDAILVRLNSILAAMKDKNPELFSVLDLATDDSAGLPNRTDHPGFGFDEDEPPDMGIRPYKDDFFANDEGDGEDEDKAADQPAAPAEESGDGGNGEVQSQPANDGGDADAPQGGQPPEDSQPAGDGEDSPAQESPGPDGAGNSQETEQSDAAPGEAADPAPTSDEAQPDAAPASTGDEAQPETVPASTGDEVQPETAPETTSDVAEPEATPASTGDETQSEAAPVDGVTPENDQQPAASEQTAGGSDGSPASEPDGEPSADASTEGDGAEPQENDEDDGDEDGGDEGGGDEDDGDEDDGDESDAATPEGDEPSPPQGETPQE